MPKIAKSAEIGDIHSHTFIALLPQETIEDPTDSQFLHRLS